MNSGLMVKAISYFNIAVSIPRSSVGTYIPLSYVLPLNLLSVEVVMSHDVLYGNTG